MQVGLSCHVKRFLSKLVSLLEVHSNSVLKVAALLCEGKRRLVGLFFFTDLLISRSHFSSSFARYS